MTAPLPSRYWAVPRIIPNAGQYEAESFVTKQHVQYVSIFPATAAAVDLRCGKMACWKGRESQPSPAGYSSGV